MQARVAHICVFTPDATHPAQSPLTQRGHVAPPLGASAQAAKECGCRGEVARTQKLAKKKYSGGGEGYTRSVWSNMLTEHICMAISR